MEADANDLMKENLIDSFRPRLRVFMSVDPVLDHLPYLRAEQKESIRKRGKSHGELSAADALISAVVEKPHTKGWFQDFVDALSGAGYQQAADLIQAGRPDSRVEADNDCCMLLIDILAPSLLDMNTKEVCTHCFAREILTKDDNDVILRVADTQGPRDAARELLKRIVRCKSSWYSDFLQVLKETEHPVLYRLLQGWSDCDDGTGSIPATDSPALTSEDSQDTEAGDDTTDLYRSESALAQSPPGSRRSEASSPDLSDSGAATRLAERADIVLRDYQEEVAQPALEGKNIIICLPTGSGKTRVAVFIAAQHLGRRTEEGKTAKVVVLVNKVPLVEQHYASEFHPFLKHAYRVERVSGNSALKICFTEILKNNDVVICTAQILENYLERSLEGEDEGVHLRDISLMIIDECHHTKKGEVYNQVMKHYLKQKNANTQLRKQQKETVPLPQILGLTASLGVGAATKLETAEKNILQICANLDACQILTGDLGKYRNEPSKKMVLVEDKNKDPFGDVIKKIMNSIHAHSQLSPTCELGSQNYEQWVVQTERIAAKEKDPKVRICAEHLRRYNEAMQLSNTIRMCDAFSFLNKHHEEELKSKRSTEEEHVINITPTERLLFNLFKDSRETLQELSTQQSNENDSLSKLRENILRLFTTKEEARGIIFTKTRRSAMALSHWIQDDKKFSDVGVATSYLIGGGDQSAVKPMTAAEQKDVLTKFHGGAVNLLVATSVAEEGLDIPACNFVICYGLVTNEISMIQARGRARAKDSVYIVIEVKGSGVTEKESVNEYRKDLMTEATARIRQLSPDDYNKKIKEFQLQAILEDKMKKTKSQQKGKKLAEPSEVELSCRKCSKLVCKGDDIQIIEGMHRVNVSPHFSELYIRKGNSALAKRLLDYETNGTVACKNCGQTWGSMMVYRSIDCPCLQLKNLVVSMGDKKMSHFTKWSELAVNFQAFDYIEHASCLADHTF
ncbi:interferon-induced helicase C domain-containing protein 1 [Nerophis ophidion]|uniref:interferon-induced helicase C domain-containing protein 1 n=1 Tax=Nerophis ophidion TaxID=159077 RepID=UPI002ADFBA40|nr:interferon-induced helicase C domain-containing protein 1 [Nerophis ophidion]